MSKNLEQEIKELTREELERLLLEQTEQVDYCYKRIEELHNTIDKAIEKLKYRQEDINNGGNEHEYRTNKAVLEILGGTNE